MDEKISVKIKKLFELSKDNSNPNESKNAMMKAQALLAKYKLSMSDIECVEIEPSEVILEKTGESFTSKTHLWKNNLSKSSASWASCARAAASFALYASLTRAFLSSVAPSNFSFAVLTTSASASTKVPISVESTTGIFAIKPSISYT